MRKDKVGADCRFADNIGFESGTCDDIVEIIGKFEGCKVDLICVECTTDQGDCDRPCPHLGATTQQREIAAQFIDLANDMRFLQAAAGTALREVHSEPG